MGLANKYYYDEDDMVNEKRLAFNDGCNKLALELKEMIQRSEDSVSDDETSNHKFMLTCFLSWIDLAMSRVKKNGDNDE